MAEKLEIPTREEIIRRYERDYQLLNPGARVGPRTLPGIDARIQADQLLPLYAEAATLGGGSDLENIAGTDLEDEAEDLGLPRRLLAVGASGAVIVNTVIGGETIFAGTQCTNEKTGFRYACTTTQLYLNGAQVPVLGVETGPESDVPAASVLKWSSPPAGLGDTCIVVTQSDGSGLSGGRADEVDDDIRIRIRAKRAEPALAGNGAEYRAQALLTPGLSIQAAFTHSAILGPGTIGLAFTMQPGGASRRPNATQIAAVRAHVIGKMPSDDGLFSYALLDDPLDVDLRVRWSRASSGWSDLAPWPLYHATQPYYVTVTSGDALHASIATLQTTPVPPGAGSTIAFWDVANVKFVRKTVLQIDSGIGTTGSPWVVSFTSASGASDAVYIPQLNDRPMPWSDSLADLGTPFVDEFNKLGPSDHSSFDFGGLRRRREPSGFEAFPYELSGRILIPVYGLPAVDDVQVVSPALPRATPSGTIGSTSYLTSLRSLRAYPL